MFEADAARWYSNVAGKGAQNIRAQKGIIQMKSRQCGEGGWRYLGAGAKSAESMKVWVQGTESRIDLTGFMRPKGLNILKGQH
jgi:hypothetical protein